jgi:hypothetical protein
MTPLTLERLQAEFGGRIEEATNRVVTHVEIDGGAATYNVYTALALDSSAPNGLRVSCNRGHQTAVQAIVFGKLGLPIPEPANDNKPSTLPLIDPSKWDGVPVPERRWFVPDMVPMRTVTNLSGEGGSGKTGLALQLMAASALQTPWLGIDVLPGKSIYFGAEDEADELHRRLACIVAGMGGRLSDLSGLRVIPMAERDAVLARPMLGRMAMTDLLKQLVEAIADFRPQLVVLDPAADVFGGDEIKRDQVRGFIGMLRTVALSFDCAVLLLSHPSLTGINSGSGSSGSTAWSNSVRSRLYLETPKENGVPDPQARVLKTMKANYGPVGSKLKLRWSDGIYALDAGPDPAVEALTNGAVDRLYVELLTLLNEQGHNLSPAPSVTYAPAVMAKHPKAKGYRKEALAGAQQRLLDAGRIRIEEHGKPSRRQRRLVVVPPDPAE